MPINDLTTRQKFSTIIVSEQPRGLFLEGILDTIARPGEHVSLKANGHYERWNGAANGERDELLLVLNSKLEGKSIDDAYGIGDRVFLYTPVRGEEFLVMYDDADDSGTTDSLNVADKLILQDGTGKVMSTASTPEMEPYKVLEDYDAIDGDLLIHVRCIA